jgi:hypothetical protein
MLFFGFFILSRTFLFSEEKIYFLHIPKTGGSTVIKLLRQHYSYGRRNEDIRLIGMRHLTYCQAKEIFKRYKIFTFLREPVARVLSEHRFCMNIHRGFPRMLNLHFLPAQGSPIETASNIVCKILSGLDPRDSEISIEQHLASAKKNLAEELFFIGITEKMNESIELLYHLMGWQPPKEIPICNATDSSKEFYSQDVLDGIAKRNWADIELYEYALKLFENQKKL